jgi:hypothetical protein
MATPAMAETITFNWTGSTSYGTFGNSRSLTVTQGTETVKVTATAWSYTYGSSDNAFAQAALGTYGAGLGVCNSSETGFVEPTGSNCASPEHAIGNTYPNLYNGDDFVLFLFSRPDGTPLAVDPTSVVVDPFGVTYDTDVSYWLGNVGSSLNLSGKTYADLASLGFGSQVDNFADPSSSQRTVSIPPVGGPFYNALLFGAQIEPGGGEDYFKLRSLTISTAPPPPPSVPEPVTLVLMGLGMAGLQQYRRRVAARA